MICFCVLGSVGGIWWRAHYCICGCVCACDCVCVSKQKRESERERGRLSQTDLLISHLKAGVCFRMGEIGRWSCQRKKGRHEVERKDKRWLGGMGGSFRDWQLTNIDDAWIERLDMWNKSGWTGGRAGDRVYRGLALLPPPSEIDALSQGTQMLVAQLWHRKWWWLIDRGRWGSYPVQRTAGLLLTELLGLSLSLFYLFLCPHQSSDHLPPIHNNIISAFLHDLSSLPPSLSLFPLAVFFSLRYRCRNAGSDYLRILNRLQ